MRPNVKKLAAGGLFLAVTAFSSAAWAGYKNPSGQVYVNQNTREAAGSMGAARNSADNTQYIGCSLEWTAGGGITGQCKARAAAGQELECSIHNPSSWILQTLGTITPDSLIRFHVFAGGECDRLSVSNYSWDMPR